MDFLKALFADGALTYDDFVRKITAAKNIKLANLADGGYVEKFKFDKANEEKKEADAAKANAEKLLGEANKKLEGYDPTWKDQIEAAKNAAADELKKIKLGNAVSSALTTAKVRDQATITPLLDMSKVAMDGEVLVGLTDQINALKQSHGYLFEDEQKPEPAGRAGSGMNHNDAGKPDYDSMSDEEYYAAVLKPAT